MNEANKISSLAKLMATFNFLQGKKVTYGQVERFLKKTFKTGPLIVFSKSSDSQTNGNAKEALRVSWNKRSYGGHYSKKNLDEVMNRVQGEKEPVLGKVRYEDKDYFIFECGEAGKQRFFGLFEIENPLDDETLQLFSLFMTNIGKGWNRLDELKKVENLVHVDDVTGLYNQRKLLKDIDMAIDRYRELDEVFSLLFIDIDHFKSVNDGHGHLVGTHLLASLGELLKNTLRESDLIYRYGGDEFVMIIPDVEGDTAIKIGDRVLKAVKKSPFIIKLTSEGDKVHEFNLSVSIGVASFPTDAHNQEEILAIADSMMYEAKRSGRGRVCFTKDLIDSPMESPKASGEKGS